jgi:hypothetical protein
LNLKCKKITQFYKLIQIKKSIKRTKTKSQGKKKLKGCREGTKTKEEKKS